MTITLGWWAVPIALVIVGGLLAWVYHAKHYSPGGYFGDPITPLFSLVIFVLFALTALGICIGKWFF